MLAALVAASGGGCRSVATACPPVDEPTPEQRYFEWARPTFPSEVHAGRRARLASAVAVSGGGVFLAPSAPGRSRGETFRQADDFLYLTGLELPDSVLALESESGHWVLFAPERDARFESADRPGDFPGRPLRADSELVRHSGIVDWRPVEELEAALADWAREGRALRLQLGRGGDAGPTPPVRRLSAEEALAEWTRARVPHARIESAFEAVAATRMVKGPEEIERIRRACAITLAGIRDAAAHVAPGVDERTLEAELEASFKRRGAQRLAFDSIIKSGPNSLWPWRILASHYDRRNREMAAGELVVFDVGCELDHYASDVGRTFPVSGRFTPDQRSLLEMITAVSDAVIESVRPGVTLGELQAVALARIPAEHEKYMQAGLFFGHHVGLDVGDPSLGDRPLAPGMTFTIEPWYYDHDTGVAVFVEDVVLVTEGGCANLTAALPRSARGLEALVGSARRP